MDTTKKCNYCLETKSLNEFHRYNRGGKTSVDGHRECCNICWNRRKELEKTNQKECRNCKQIKNKDRFYGHVCITCYNKRRYKEQRDYILTRSKRYHQTEFCHRKRMIYQARNTAKAQNLPFNLELSDIIIPEFCPVLGVKLKLDNKFNDRDSSPSLDRLVPNKGYVKENVRVICDRANRIKSNGTISEHEKIIEYMRQNGCE